MSDCSNLIYYYDGSFEGLLCCVFESYEKKEIPEDILINDTPQGTLFPVKEIITDLHKAQRIMQSIPEKMGIPAFEFIQYAFITCLPKKEWYILLFFHLGYKHGPKVMNMLSNSVVNTLFKANKHLTNESHLLKGFIRFSIINNTLVAEIEPKNYVLPLLVTHFKERYPEEQFIIHDKTHSMVLIYKPYEAAILPSDSLQIPEVDDEERHYRKLWHLFYETIEIKGRHNPKCRMGHMPKRYWKYLTEFNN